MEIKNKYRGNEKLQKKMKISFRRVYAYILLVIYSTTIILYDIPNAAYAKESEENENASCFCNENSIIDYDDFKEDNPDDAYRRIEDKVIVDTQDDETNGFEFLQSLIKDSDVKCEVMPNSMKNASSKMKKSRSVESEKYAWTIGIYMCGTNLESEGGYATNDIIEMLDAKIPGNVKVLLFTGGTKKWNPNNSVHYGYCAPSNLETQLYEITDTEMKLVKGYGENLNMGSTDTLKTFLTECNNLAPSERLMTLFWNHGGGPIYGFASDELYNDDGLFLYEMKNAFNYIKEERGKKIDLIVFDACLMGAFEVAYMFKDSCSYLVGSSTIIPANGLYYEWLSKLNDEYTDGDEVDTLDPVSLGKNIIDLYPYTFNQSGLWEKSLSDTLALIDLSRMDDLKDAFNSMAQEIYNLKGDEKEFIKLTRIVEKVQSPYKNCGLVDLYDFAHDIYNKMPDDVPSAKKVMEVLGSPSDDVQNKYVGDVAGDNPVVIYIGTGKKLDECIGLSFFYPVFAINSTSLTRSVNACLQLYGNFGISEIYTLYLEAIITNMSSLGKFSGEMNTRYDKTLHHFILNIPKSSDSIVIKKVDYLITKNEVKDDNKVRYLLGSMPTNEDWENMNFIEQAPEKWYAFNDEFVTAFVNKDSDDMETYEFPITVYFKEGSKNFLIYAYKKIDGNDNRIIIDYLSELDDNGSVSRKIRINADFLFYSNMYEYVSFEDRKVKGVQNNNAIRAIYDSELERCTLDSSIQYLDLASGSKDRYEGFFQVADVNSDLYMSDACKYRILNDFKKQIVIKDIPTQIYTGEEICPNIHLMFGDEELSNEVLPYTVNYSNNVQKGDEAKVEVTSSLTEELPGTIMTTFKIADKYTAINDWLLSLKNVPNIENQDSLEYETYMKELEEFKVNYERLTNSEREKISQNGKKYLSDAYKSAIEKSKVKTQNGFVEISGILFGLDNNLMDTTLEEMYVYQKEEVPTKEKMLEVYNKINSVDEKSTNKEKKCYQINVKKKIKESLELEDANILSSNKLVVKMKLDSRIDTSSLNIYQIVDGKDELKVMNVNIVSEDNANYAVFEIDEFGYFTLCYNVKNITSSSSKRRKKEKEKESYDEKKEDIKENAIEEKINDVKEEEREEKEKYSNIFSDVKKDDWFFEAAVEASKYNIMNGVDGNNFSPNQTATRDMIVTILWRLEGMPYVNYAMQFKDVKQDEWYSEAVRWANANKIVNGYSIDTYGTGDAITREDLVSILYRYAAIKGYDVDNKDNESIVTYKDLSKISDYTLPAILWANESNIMNGTEENLFSPKDNATRAQVATVFVRMINNFKLK